MPSFSFLFLFFLERELEIYIILGLFGLGETCDVTKWARSRRYIWNWPKIRLAFPLNNNFAQFFLIYADAFFLSQIQNFPGRIKTGISTLGWDHRTAHTNTEHWNTERESTSLWRSWTTHDLLCLLCTEWPINFVGPPIQARSR